MRKAREEAKIAAVERAKAKARARREAEAALPPSMSVDEVIRSVLQAEGIVKVTADEQQQLSKKIVGEENRVALDDLALKGKLVAALVCEARVHLAHADMTKARTVGDLRALAKEASGAEPVVKHPVAAWFTKQQAAGKLPPNVQFVAYSKKDKLKLKEIPWSCFSGTSPSIDQSDLYSVVNMSQSKQPTPTAGASSWSDVVKTPSKSQSESGQAPDHQRGHATAQARDPPPNTSYADLSTPSASSASFSTSARKFAHGHGDPVSKVIDRVSAATVRSGTGSSTDAAESDPGSDSRSAAFPSVHSANPHDPQDVDPVLAPLVDEDIAQQAMRTLPEEITKGAGSADIKQGATAANTLAAAAEASAALATDLAKSTAAVKDTDLGRNLDRIEPRNQEEPNVTIETPEPVVPMTETPRGGTAVQLGVIEATQQNVPIRTTTAAHDKSVIDKATGGYVPGTQEQIEPEQYATTADQPELIDSDEGSGAQEKPSGPSEIEKATHGYVPGTQERILHASGTSAPPPTPISQLDASPTAGGEQGAEAQVPMLPETMTASTAAGKHGDREAQWILLDPEASVHHAKHALTHAVHKAKQAVPPSTHEIKVTAAQVMDKAKDVMPTSDSVSGAVSSASSAVASGASKVAESTRAAADQASASISDTAAHAKATFDSAYDSATSTASSAADSVKSTLLASTATESSHAKPLSHAERAQALLDQIQDVAAIGPDAVRATLAAGSSSVESGSVGGSTGPTPAKEHAIAATSHGHKMSPEEAAEARADNLFAKYGGGDGGAGVRKQTSEPQPATTGVSGGGNTTSSGPQLAQSTPASAHRAEHILANYESAASIGPDAVRAALAAGTTHYPHKSLQHEKPKAVPPAVAQRILEQARASIDQLTAGGHNEVDLVASESSSLSSSSSIDTTLGEGLDYAASFARGVRAGMTQAARDVEKDVYETIRKSEGELAIPTTAEQVKVDASDTVHHRAEEAKEAVGRVVPWD
ncbi:hypothetical protein BCR44DRAFT_1459250 [Catenaria anguillulae PL171]|uniref:Uncharacterized protein n=1 Tax=Catenaria anguillulae PL171 TaxID=765915 RepID=A0A1Y2HTH0_9FUNG|nr:hypothetical protein BCR44DRAFT_1459250 [Catenaria anguillulae PL171]